jgi:hypothetical protein
VKLKGKYRFLFFLRKVKIVGKRFTNPSLTGRNAEIAKCQMS